MLQQQLEMKHEYPSPEAKKLLGQLMYHTSEVFSETYIPFVLVNRKAAIQHIQDAKVTLDKLLKVV